MGKRGFSKRDKNTDSKGSSSSVGGKPSLLKDIAASTIKAIEHGSYEADGISYDVKEKIDLSKANTVYYAADSDISDWRSIPQELVNSTQKSKVHITVSECSTLAGARELKERLQSSMESLDVKQVGVLSFGSAKNPGGGFINGAQAQVCPFSISFEIYAFNSSFLTEKYRKNHLRVHQHCIQV